ncbi:MAG TPA: TraB/GumN family protein [Thermoplasmata archaeon]|nr:TraB/GumN family protein [Thermoplasmata archaeon]HUJ78410.1 TraB/GumN family protein [Thermoplasmata archaeon]
MFASTLEGPVLLIGSAHVVDLEAPLRSALADRTLDAIAVELDAERATALLAPAAVRRPSSRRGQPVVLRLWASIQRRLGEQLGGELPGAEMRTAAEVARERGIPLLLIDDPIRETLARLFRSLSVRERVSLLFGAVVGLLIPPRLVERQLDRYTEAPADYLEELRRMYPSIARVLLDDRNEHMARRLADMRVSGYGRIAAVVGDAHLPGLAAALRRRAVPVETIGLGTLRPVRAP